MDQNELFQSGQAGHAEETKRPELTLSTVDVSEVDFELPPGLRERLLGRLQEAARSDRQRASHVIDQLPHEFTGEGRFTVVQQLGSGGLGEVLLCHDQQLDRKIALKLCKYRPEESQQHLDRFRREYQLLARLQHPTITPVYQMGSLPDGRPFYVMKFIDGPTLLEAASQLDDPQRTAFPCSPSLRELLGAFLDICCAVEHAHELGVIHRDLKPQNLMLDSSRRGYVVDWGLAKQLAEGPEQAQSPLNRSLEDPALTTCGTILGTPAWLSPEQAAAGVHTAATDIYGLGAVLYHIVTGRPPHQIEVGETQEAYYRRISTVMPPRADSVCQRLSPVLASICERAMQLDSLERYQSVSELKDDLQRWLRNDIVVAHQSRYTALQRLEKFGSRYQRPILLTLGILLCALLGTGWGAWQISLAAAQTEQALEREQQANAQFFTSLEKYADTVMSSEVLAAPELHDLRRRVLAELAAQYQNWTARAHGTPAEQIRAAQGFLRLAEIEEQTGDLVQAQRNVNQAVQLAGAALRQDDLAATERLVFCRALRTSARFFAMNQQVPEALAAVQRSRLELAQVVQLLDSVSLLEEECLATQSQAEVYFQAHWREPAAEAKREYLEHALRGFEQVRERREALLQLAGSFQRQQDLSAALNSLALIHHKLSQTITFSEELRAMHHQSARQFYRAALDRLDQLEADPVGVNAPGQGTDTRVPSLRIRILMNQLMTLREARAYDELRFSAQAAIDISRRLQQQAPLVTRYWEDELRGLWNLADGQMDQFQQSGQLTCLEEAIVTFRNGIKLGEQLAVKYPSRGLQQISAIQYLRLSSCLYFLERKTEALDAFQNCLKLTEHPELLEPGHQPNALATARGYQLLSQRLQEGQPVPFNADQLQERIAHCLSLAESTLLRPGFHREFFLQDLDLQSSTPLELLNRIMGVGQP